ncbi:ral GTPase-activating protein subunit alpha-1-like isoform X5 [Mytilus galloprovincialis]|uniref:ral GTPase-activating protein subunit alpha-1-like isoform X5 n=1 Tax=Mytilus galloprovincialis TaxID=29158 RepID=UPI003F7B7D5C
MSSALAMFRTKTTHGDIKKSAQKVSDHKKDSITRLKHLRLVIDNYEVVEAKAFFESNYSHIYYIFNDNFATVEADLKQRANKAHREELEGILNIFEKILLLLPELIQRRWMFHSIGRIMKKLLHPGNGIKTRKEGMRLFIIWYQILQESASEECHDIFLQLVPGLGDGIDQTALQSKSTADSFGGMISPDEITPILPSSGEKLPDNVTKHFFDCLIYYLVSEVSKIVWLNDRMKETGFVFLFYKFKSSYLKWLLPDFDKNSSVYRPELDLPSVRKMEDMKSKDLPNNVAECRYSYIKWLAHFMINRKQEDETREPEQETTDSTDVDPSKEQVEFRNNTAERMPGSNTSTLSTTSHGSEHDSTNSSLCYEEFENENDIVRSVLFSTRENVNVIHESFRQALLFTFKQAKAIKTVIGVYKDWFQHADCKPIFMQEPCDMEHGSHNRETPEIPSTLSDILEEDASSDESTLMNSGRIMPSSSERLDKTGVCIRNPSYLGAIDDLAEDHTHCDIQAGVQKVLQIFITNAANVFLLQTEDSEMLVEQVDLCKKVLNIYRFLVMNVKMEQRTWEQMLQVLLSITSGVLDTTVPKEKEKSLGGKLAQAIFQTLIVTWIKANLNVFISVELWDKFLAVLSSLTSWPELITEWAKTMETLTRMLAKQVYNLDLLDLPLQRLSEQKEKRRRGRSQDIPKSKVNDKSFSKAWSKSDLPTETHSSSSIHGSTFERGKLNKSDGAGGSRSRPDLGKQRSSSNVASPTHSRTPSNASDTALYVHSKTTENFFHDPAEFLEQLKGSATLTSPKDEDKSNDADNVTHNYGKSWSMEDVFLSFFGKKRAGSIGTEDQEVASITMSSLEDADKLLDDSQDINFDKRYSRSPSPGSVNSRTPSPICELNVENQTLHKDSPSADRDSLHIEMVVASDESHLATVSESLEDMKGVLAGGLVTGWTPDVAVGLWRRMLGTLGGINKVEDAENHALVFEELSLLIETMNKMKENAGVSLDNLSSPLPSEYIPPLFYFAPWLFECLSLSNKYKRGKLLAYQLLCQMIVQRHDVPVPSEMASQFYLLLHRGLVSNDQDIINVLVKYCGVKFLSMSVTGSSLLVLDFIQAAGAVISAVDINSCPRPEAVSILGGLTCFPNHFTEFQVIDSNYLMLKKLQSKDFKEQIMIHLLRAGKKEQSGYARSVAVSGIGIFLYEELSHGTLHPKLNEAFIVIFGNLRCVNRSVARVATDMLAMLVDHIKVLLDYHPELPKRIIEVVMATVSTLIPVSGISNSDEEKKLIISMMFCVVDWCMHMPINSLLETTDSDKGCIYKVFQMLNYAVSGHTEETLNQVKQSLIGMIQDADFDNLRDLTSNFTRRPSPDKMSSRSSDSPKPESHDTVKLAAKTLINHLVNHLCHFPMGSGASRINSSIQEFHDWEDMTCDDLKSDLFFSPNLQFFILNKRTLISFIELSALTNAPGGGVTAGLTTARTVCRVILRDLTGKYSWDSSVLYAPPWCNKGSSLNNAKALLDICTEIEREPLLIQEEEIPPSILPSTVHRSPSQIPYHQTDNEVEYDNLNDLLGYIGYTSPECILEPGLPLNVEAPIPEGLSEDAENVVTDMVIDQKDGELDYYQKHKNSQRHVENVNLIAQPQMPLEVQDPVSPFQICRMLLNQMGLLAWEKRCSFDLLKKSDSMLRQLKYLDNQKCRETHKFAVIYVAEGQEDKNSILNNTGGSKAYEDFISGLGWEIDLETHQGFLGGLHQNKSTGDTAPYFATSLYECIYHVSTRMPSGSDEAIHTKIKHLGNDEVHIVWSEHFRDYRRGIIPTEFGDVIIVIYPLPNGLYRIQIIRKAEIPYFGPLFNGAIVDRKILPGLVRAAAINASRIKRAQMSLYHSFYEERAKGFDTLVQNHIDMTMFEDFSASVFAPVLPANSTICDQTTDLPQSASSSSLEQTFTSPDQMSPSSARQSRGSSTDTANEEGPIKRTARRLSLRSRKTGKSTSVTPPSSPLLKQ